MRIVERALEPMSAALAVPHWRINVTVGRCSNPNHVASCSRQAEYYQAQIIIDPDKAEDEDDVLNSLRHELLHVVLGDVDLMFDAMRDEDGHVSVHQHRMWEFAVERMVATLEKLLHNLRDEDLILLRDLRVPEDGEDEEDTVTVSA